MSNEWNKHKKASHKKLALDSFKNLSNNGGIIKKVKRKNLKINKMLTKIDCGCVIIIRK